MSNDNLERNGPGPGHVTLREYIERIFNEHRTAHDQRHAADQEAIRQARQVIDGRLEKLNELRSEVQEDRGSYATKDAIDVRLKPLESMVSQVVTKEILDGRLKPLEQGVGTYLTTSSFETYKKEQAQTQKEREERAIAQRKANTTWLITLAVSVAGLAIALFAR